MRYMHMSNLTPQDVDVKLTATRNELVEEDTRLWEGLEDEKISRIAGDEANKQLTLQVQNENVGTESRLSTEVIHRSEGDLSSISSLNALAIALSDYRIKTDLEIANEIIARQQLGVDLNNSITMFVASWNHEQYLLYQAIQTVQSDVDNKYSTMDQRIRKYEDLLQDITTDSIQITMDNGDINMGAWTILSQAREWDLEILAQVKGFQDSTSDDLNQALEDLQNKLPIEQDLISKVIEALSDAPIITKLSDMLNSSISNQDDLGQRLAQEAVARAEDIIKLASQQAIELANEKQVLADQINLEAQERIDAITREGKIRYNQIVDLEDGFTSRFDLIKTEQSTSLTAFNNYKASTDNSLANFNTSINLISGDLASQGSVVNALDLRLKDTEKTAVSAVTKSEAALTETSAQAAIINGITASLADKADASALSTLGAEITDLDGKLSLNTSSVTQLQGSLDNVNDELSNKASLTALNSLSGNVETIGNQTIVNTNALTNLKNRVDVVEGAVAVKLDASVISDYYTKGQADDKSAEIAAGKIESYDANLVIGGANLYSGPNPIPMVGQTSEGAHNAPAANSGITQLYKYLENSWLDWQDISIGDDVITSIEIMVPSGSVVGEHSIFIGSYRFGNNWYLQSARKPLKEFPRDKWVKLSVPAGKFVDSGLTTPDGINISIWLSSCDAGTSFKWRNLMMEKGTKSSTFSESDKTLQFNINANANAIQTVTAEVVRVNGEVVATTTSVNNLSSSVGLLQGSINEVRQTVTNNQESTNTLVTSLRSGMADADDVSMMMRNATVLFEDLSFKNGWNEVEVYNNSANGALTANFTDKLPDNPVASTRQLQFTNSGGVTSPGLGGYYQITWSRSNAVFLVKFVAKLPVGFSFALEANAFGDGATRYFIGGNEGTGKFKTYYAVYRCGAIGGFSVISYVYVLGSQPTPENPLIWYLASSTVYDCLDSKVAPDSVINGIAEAKSTASTAVNKAEATAVIAQNLKASLDNANATISSNYLVHANATQSLADKVDKIGSKVISSSNENLFKGDLTTIPKSLAPGITSFTWDGAVIFDASAGHLAFIALDLGIDPYVINNSSQYGGPVTVSMDYSVGENTTLALPHFYFGKGYQECVDVSSDPIAPYKWRRIYTTFYTDANSLLSSPHLGLHSIVGRVYVKNLKVERGELTVYSADIKETTKSINGIEAIKTVTIDNNGVMSGYGLISELKNGQVTSSFGVNADTFFVGAPASNKKPFIVTSYPQTINGVSYPAGTWIDVALIANATIGTAKIDDLAVTGAKIANATIDNAKIANIDAAKITTGTLDAGRIRVGSSTQFDSGFAPTDVLNNAKTYVDSNTGNLVNNPSVSGNASRWSSGTVSNQNFLGTTIPVLTLTSSGDLMVSCNSIEIDPAKAYEVSVWVKKSAAVGSTYLGLYSLNEAGSIIQVNSVNQEGETYLTDNFYHWYVSGASNPTDWIKLVAYVMPAGTNPLDMKMIGNVASNAFMLPNARKLQMRLLNYYNGGVTTTAWFANPKIVEVDPNVVIAASKAQILANGAASTASTAKGAADAANALAGAAKNQAAAAENQMTLWKYPNTTYIDGGKIYANSITANQISADAIEAISVAARSYTTIGADGSKQVISGGKTEMFYPNGQLGIYIGVS